MVVSNRFVMLWVNAVLRCMRYRSGHSYIGWMSWIKSRISIGQFSGTGWGFVVRGAGMAHIGNYCAIGENVRIITSNHDTARLSINFKLQQWVTGQVFVSSKRDVTIGHDVWIGDNVIILPGVSIGNGAIIGAGSVVTRSVPDFAIAAGVPSTCIKQRFPDAVTDRLNRLQWWQLPPTALKQLHALFLLDMDAPESLATLDQFIEQQQA